MAFISSLTDVIFVDTSSSAGVIFMPSTFDNVGQTLIFKDKMGSFQTSSITFSTLAADQTFEDGTTYQTYSDRFASYSFIASSNKWFLVGGPRMNSASISTFTTNTLQVQTFSTQQVVASTLQFEDSLLRDSRALLFSKDTSLFFDTTAWGGARASFPLLLPVKRYVVTEWPVVTGASFGTVTVGSIPYRVIGVGGGQTATLTFHTPAVIQVFLLGGGGGGGAGNTQRFGTTYYYNGNGGGGGGGVINTSNSTTICNPGTYILTGGVGGTRGTNLAAPTSGGDSSIRGPSLNLTARGGRPGVEGTAAAGFNGNGGGGGGFGVSDGGRGGGSGAGSFGGQAGSSGGTTGNGGNGGNGGLVYNFTTNSMITYSGGGGAGTDGGTPGVGGTGGGGTGGGWSGNPTAGSSGLGGGGGGGGGPDVRLVDGGIFYQPGENGGSGFAQIRYTLFTKIYG
jgi:hypothetical protein